MLKFNTIKKMLKQLIKSEEPISIYNDLGLIIFDSTFNPEVINIFNYGYKCASATVNCLDSKIRDISIWRIFLPLQIYQAAINDFVTIIYPINVGIYGNDMCNIAQSTDVQWWFKKFTTKDPKQIKNFDSSNSLCCEEITYLGQKVYPQSLLISNNVLNNSMKYIINPDGSWYYEFFIEFN